jgi:hypothetical protein
MTGSRPDQAHLSQTASPQEQSLLLGVVPRDIRTQLINSLLPIDVLGLFAQTCKKAETETAFLRLLHAAAFALPESYQQEDKTKLAAIAILKRYPGLLFQKGYTRDPAGNLLYGSAYQIFLGAGDVWALQTIHEEIIPNINDGEVVAKDQYQQQFPNGEIYDDRNHAQIAQAKEDLKEIVAAISIDRCAHGKATLQRTRSAIRALREHLAPQRDAIQTGLYSPPEILKIIHEVYGQNVDAWTWEKLCLYSYELIGGGERSAASVDAQCYRRGLTAFDIKIPPDRTSSYFSRFGASADLGHSRFIDIYNGAANSCYWEGDRGGVFACFIGYGDYFEKFVDEKSKGLQSLCCGGQEPIMKRVRYDACC